ncbi:zinc finger FYVE domain-containing protein 1-like isoform X2 [Planococcus citri]|uniref:zinc finger FYVE domain-containing protein 1-like isoform X2 n=1 Tax=Planococcus citri TaxID=170843 RepID=UPI0031F8F7C9
MDIYPEYFKSSMKTSLSTSPAIMESIDSPSLILTVNQQSTCHKDSIASPNINYECSTLNVSNVNQLEKKDSGPKCFLLINEKEQLKVNSPEDFIKKLRCDENAKVKVVAICGNTGDGKSFTMNECFFNGKEVFSTSSEQDSCTIGIWTAYDSHSKVICIDTEGLLGSTNNENQRTRLLLKVLAISDIVIYRTRSERLHRDLFTFLGTVSKAYTHHFNAALQSVSQKTEYSGTLSALGPAVIIFHETRHTKVLKPGKNESPEDIIRSKFAQMRLDIEAFSSLKYVGVQTPLPPTSFKDLQNAIIAELDNTTVRSSRSPRIVFLTLKALNDKFSGDIESTTQEIMFPDQYFTCPVRCLSCETRCSCSMGHLNENLPHTSGSKCKYQHQYNNCMYICKQCHTNGKEVIVTPKYSSSSESSWFAFAKYAWSGYVIECPHHGEIYRSRQFWYGNADPEMKAVRSEIQHVWPDGKTGNHTLQNPAQRVIDGVSYLSEAVYNASAEPSRYVTSWVADQIAPKYWELNAEIKSCNVCKKDFTVELTKHHCRACGKGVCKNCSVNNRPVPERGWTYPVRVCDNCICDTVDRISISSDISSDDTEVRVRKVGEAVVNTISSVASVLEYPKSLIKDTARPPYWVPDSKISSCCVCGVKFKNFDTNVIRKIHHCRDCGEGVCSSCSTNRRTVAHRGWENPVRVCDNCVK